MGVVDYKTQTLKPQTSLVFDMEKLHIYIKVWASTRKWVPPRDESDKIDYGFLGPSGCNKNVNPEIYVPCDSYELEQCNLSHEGEINNSK